MSSLRSVLAALFVASPLVAAAQPAEEPSDSGHSMGPSPLGIQETRSASGTAWQPDSTPMFMWHASAGGWQLGLHTNSFFGYDGASSGAGDDFISINWLMGMASHPIGNGDLTLRAMMSAEPATMPENGYPLVLQSGETFDGEPLHDRQHPHDLFMELAARYRQPLASGLGLELYAAPVGEPAIGPPAFPHRYTAMGDPLAPLGHHWFDSTHITFGVLTAGLFTKTFKLEGSWFNGREPDENRWDFDLRQPDSFAARLSANPTPDLSAQVSWARLESPEALEPDVSIHRTTASVIWNRRLDDQGTDIGVSAAVGQNNYSMGPSTYASLVEGTAMFDDTHTVFARAEALTKRGEDLALDPAMHDDTFRIGALSAGYIYDLDEIPSLVTGIGVVGTVDVVGRTLGDVYDTRTPWGGMVFVRIRPPTMKMDSSMKSMSHESGMHHHHTM